MFKLHLQTLGHAPCVRCWCGVILKLGINEAQVCESVEDTVADKETVVCLLSKSSG